MLSRLLTLGINSALFCLIFLSVALLGRWLTKRLRHQSDLLSLQKWLQFEQLQQGHKFFTQEGQILADNFYQRLHTVENRLRYLEKASLTDELTKLLNRRGINERLLSENNRLQREHSQCYSLLLFDIDHFKKINDNYGHLIGDRILCEVARLTQTILRRSDDCSRWGGEEFLILLPNAEAHEALNVAHKLCELISQHSFTEKNLNITITVGLATAMANNSISEVLNAADNHLYEGKNQGRNCIVSCKFNEQELSF